MAIREGFSKFKQMGRIILKAFLVSASDVYLEKHSDEIVITRRKAERGDANENVMTPITYVLKLERKGKRLFSGVLNPFESIEDVSVLDEVGSDGPITDKGLRSQIIERARRELAESITADEAQHEGVLDGKDLHGKVKFHPSRRP